jgi:hypothetical protein
MNAGGSGEVEFAGIRLNRRARRPANLKRPEMAGNSSCALRPCGWAEFFDFDFCTLTSDCFLQMRGVSVWTGGPVRAAARVVLVLAVYEGCFISVPDWNCCQLSVVRGVAGGQLGMLSGG